jgi:hypothetical protein
MLQWPEAADSRLLWITFLLLLFLALWVGGSRADPKLKGTPFKRPMLSLELAGSVEESRRVIELSEKADGEARAKFHQALLWDFVFLFLYPASTALACFIATRFLNAYGLVDFKYGLLLMCLQFLAAILDITENFALLRILGGPIESPWPQVARWCAIPKFTIVFAGTLYAIMGGIVWIVTRFINRAPV